jgi:hypothetical protein
MSVIGGYKPLATGVAAGPQCGSAQPDRVIQKQARLGGIKNGEIACVPDAKTAGF